STLHDMRFVFFDNDTRILFATAYDGAWDAYINDFATKIPELMALLFQNVEGWPGIHSPDVTAIIAEHTITASGCFVANSSVPAVAVRTLQRTEAAPSESLYPMSGRAHLDAPAARALKKLTGAIARPEGVDHSNWYPQ